MTFLDCISELPEQPDLGLRLMIAYLKEDKNFPNTSDVEIMSHYLYKKLDYPKTYAFQKLLMVWFMQEKKDNNPNVLDDLNLIINLQNRDPHYIREE